MKLRLPSSFILFCLISVLAYAETSPNVGVKYSRPYWQYYTTESGSVIPLECRSNDVCQDFIRLRNDRIYSIMIALPWGSWQPDAPGGGNNGIDKDLLQRINDILLVADPDQKLEIMLAIHSTTWCSGDWSYPGWVKGLADWDESFLGCDQNNDGITTGSEFRAPESILFNESMNDVYIEFLTVFIDTVESGDYPELTARLKGYNIMGEMVTAGPWAIDNNFDGGSGGNKKGAVYYYGRWAGVKRIYDAIKSSYSGSYAIYFGNAGSEPGYGAYIWDEVLSDPEADGSGNWQDNYVNVKNDTPLTSDAVDIDADIWSDSDYISAQTTAALKAYTGSSTAPKIRTEEVLTNAFYKKIILNSMDWENTTIPWKDNDNSLPRYWDYAAAYNFEGIRNQAIENYEAFYAWHMGITSYDEQKISLLDHRAGKEGMATPYYYALRDLASGIDSFEIYDLTATNVNDIDEGSLTKEQQNQLLNNFDVYGDTDGDLDVDTDDDVSTISSRWLHDSSSSIEAILNSTGYSIVPSSTVYASVSISPGEKVFRVVNDFMYTHLQGDDDFVFAARLVSGSPGDIKIWLDLYGDVYECDGLSGLTSTTEWQVVRIPLSSCGLGSETAGWTSYASHEIGFGLVNTATTGSPVVFYVDDILIRGADHDWDHDGILDSDETGENVFIADADGDGLLDGEECQPPAADGKTYRIYNNDHGVLIPLSDTENADPSANDSGYMLAASSNESLKLWHLVSVGSGYYNIVNVATDRLLSKQTYSSSDDVPFVSRAGQESYYRSQWSIVGDIAAGSVNIKNRHNEGSSPKYLTLDSAAIEQWNPGCGGDCGTKSQDWVFVEVASTCLVTTDPDDADSDADGLKDGYEYYYQNKVPAWGCAADPSYALDPLVASIVSSVKIGDADCDADGVENSVEAEYWTSIFYKDTDNDYICDMDEVNGWFWDGSTDITKKVYPDPLSWDTDGDGISDGVEGNLASKSCQSGSVSGTPLNPVSANTDGDDFDDKYEMDHTWNGNGSIPDLDFDGDGLRDSCYNDASCTDDTDDDNDGIADASDSGDCRLNPDCDDDGIIDGVDPDVSFDHSNFSIVASSQSITACSSSCSNPAALSLTSSPSSHYDEWKLIYRGTNIGNNYFSIINIEDDTELGLNGFNPSSNQALVSRVEDSYKRSQWLVDMSCSGVVRFVNRKGLESSPVNYVYMKDNGAGSVIEYHASNVISCGSNTNLEWSLQ